MMWWWNNDGFWGSGRGWPGILTIGLGMLVCVVMMGMMMRHGMSGHSSHKPDAEDSPESILAKRLASGEIDVEEYERTRDALHRIGSSPGPAPEPGQVADAPPAPVGGAAPPGRSNPNG